MSAMVERASSLPPVVSANPFWSERAREEWQVQTARPEDLPDDEEMVMESRGSGDHQGNRERSREERRTNTGKGRGQKSDMFATPPSSWTFRDQFGGRGDGENQADESTTTREKDMSLQRELEKEVVDLLHGENTRLKREVEELKLQRRVQEAKEVLKNQEMERERMELERLRVEIMKSSKSSAWSEVSPDNGIPGPPPSTPRQTSFWKSPDEEDRYTPQGTKVPRGPPPDEVRPEVPVPPSWIRTDWEGDRAWQLRDGDCHQGRAEHHQREVYHRDRASIGGDGGCAGDRAEHHQREVCHRDRAGSGGDVEYAGDRAWQAMSYQGVQEWHHQHHCGDRGDPRGGKGRQGQLPEEERKAFEQEIKRLTDELKSKCQFQGEYWQTPTQRWDMMGMEPGQQKGASQVVAPLMNDGNLGSGRELPELSGEVTPITLGDWLVSIGPMMKDLTPLSAGWWQKTYQKAEEYYGEWRNSTPLQRVQIQPELPQELQQPQYMRTEQRGVGLLLKAVPKEVREVLIAARELCSTTIVYRLLVTCQPGGANEKALLLKHLTQINSGKDLNELGTSLRTWRRFFKRAVEIDTTLPDPTLLLKALDSPSMAIAKVDAQSAFRLAQTRS